MYTNPRVPRSLAFFYRYTRISDFITAKCGRGDRCSTLLYARKDSLSVRERGEENFLFYGPPGQEGTISRSQLARWIFPRKGLFFSQRAFILWWIFNFIPWTWNRHHHRGDFNFIFQFCATGGGNIFTADVSRACALYSIGDVCFFFDKLFIRSGNSIGFYVYGMKGVCWEQDLELEFFINLV